MRIGPLFLGTLWFASTFACPAEILSTWPSADEPVFVPDFPVYLSGRGTEEFNWTTSWGGNFTFESGLPSSYIFTSPSQTTRNATSSGVIVGHSSGCNVTINVKFSAPPQVQVGQNLIAMSCSGGGGLIGLSSGWNISINNGQVQTASYYNSVVFPANNGVCPTQTDPLPAGWWANFTTLQSLPRTQLFSSENTFCVDGGTYGCTLTYEVAGGRTRTLTQQSACPGTIITPFPRGSFDQALTVLSELFCRLRPDQCSGDSYPSPSCASNSNSTSTGAPPNPSSPPPSPPASSPPAGPSSPPSPGPSPPSPPGSAPQPSSRATASGTASFSPNSDDSRSSSASGLSLF